MQDFINSTVQRQQYYELKQKDGLVQAKLDDLKDAHEATATMYQNYVNGIAVKLEHSKQILGAEIKKRNEDQAQKVSSTPSIQTNTYAMLSVVKESHYARP